MSSIRMSFSFFWEFSFMRAAPSTRFRYSGPRRKSRTARIVSSQPS